MAQRRSVRAHIYFGGRFEFITAVAVGQGSEDGVQGHASSFNYPKLHTACGCNGPQGRP